MGFDVYRNVYRQGRDTALLVYLRMVKRNSRVDFGGDDDDVYVDLFLSTFPYDATHECYYDNRGTRELDNHR